MYRILVSLLLLVSCAAPAVADIVAPCFSARIVTAPLHPGTGERIGLRVASGGLFFEPSPDRTIVAAATVQNGIISLDAVLTDDPSAFPGYRATAWLAFQDVQAYVGPLSAGTYLVRATERQVVDGVSEMLCPIADITLTVAGTPGATQLVQAVEFFNPGLDRHTISADAREIADLDAGVHPGWLRTGEFLHVYAPGQSDGRGWPVCRYYAPRLELHFLSARILECFGLDEPWIQETDNAFEVALPDTLSGECPPNTIRVYRLWNPRTGDHRLTTNPFLRAALESEGWIAEGDGPFPVAMCAAP